MTMFHLDGLQCDISTYRQRMLQQQQQQAAKCASRFEDAWAVTTCAVHRLKYEYNLEYVWIFGSLLHQPWFTLSSDIDLAVEQLSPDQYLTALVMLQDLSPKFKIDLVQLEKCPHSLRDSILSEGQRL